jgi:hypothetical protein
MGLLVGFDAFLPEVWLGPARRSRLSLLAALIQLANPRRLFPSFLASLTEPIAR